MQTFTALYEDGVLKPTGPVNLPARSEVRVTIELLSKSSLTVGALNGFLKSLPPLDDDADGFSRDVRAIRAEFPAEDFDDIGLGGSSRSLR